MKDMILEDATLGDAFAYILLQILGYVLGLGLGLYFLVWIILFLIRGKKDVDTYVETGRDVLSSISNIVDSFKPDSSR